MCVMTQYGIRVLSWPTRLFIGCEFTTTSVRVVIPVYQLKGVTLHCNNKSTLYSMSMLIGNTDDWEMPLENTVD